MSLSDLPRHGLLTKGKLRKDVSTRPPLYICVTSPSSKARIWNETAKDFCREAVSTMGQDGDDEGLSPLKRPLEDPKGESLTKAICGDNRGK